MAWQKGPGEGYHAAKDDALTINPLLRCRRVLHRDGSQAGFIVEDEHGRTIGSSLLARDAWGNAFFKLGGSYKFNKAIYPAHITPAHSDGAGDGRD